jgi:hypothetical protein
MGGIAPVAGPGWAPAKINLALHVVGQRDDGYHLIESLVVFTRFGDRISFALADIDEFHVAGPYASAVPLDGNNLVLRARDTLRGALPPYQSKNPLSASRSLSSGRPEAGPGGSAPLPLKGARTGAKLTARPLPYEVGERCRA